MERALEHSLVLQWDKPQSQRVKACVRVDMLRLDPSHGWNQLTLLCVKLRGWFSDGFCWKAQWSLWLGPKHCPDSIPQGQAVQCYLSSLRWRPLKPQRTCCVGLSSPWPHHRFLERRGRLQKRLIIMTAQQRMHLHTTGVYVLSLRGPLPSFWRKHLGTCQS